MDIKNNIKFIPVYIFSAIVPLIMFIKPVTISDELYLVYKGSKSFMDIFSYYKMVWILISAILGLVIFLKLVKKEDFRKLYKNKINVLLIAFASLIFLSGIISDYRFISIFGFVDRYEGMLVQLTYVFFVFYINNIVESLEDVKKIIYGIMISSTFIALIGVSEFFGHNVLATTLGRKLITPVSMHGSIDKLNFAIKGKSLSSTLYNPNFVGSYMNLSIFIGIGMYMNSKRVKYKIVNALYTLLMVFSLIGCNSSAGKVGFIFGIVLYVCFLNKKILNIEKAVFVLVLVIVFLMLPNILGLNSDIASEVSNEEKSIGEKSDIDIDFIYGKNKVRFIKDEMNFDVTIKDAKLRLYYNDEELKTKMQGKNKISTNNEYINDNFVLMLADGKNALAVKMQPNFSVILGIDNNEFYLLDQYMRSLKYERKIDEFTPLVGKELIGNSRGYIWKVSIPVMKDYLILGSGPDTYAAVFPQHDLVGKAKYLTSSYAFVDKPHNMYIQMGIQTGGISLIMYILVLSIYGIQSLKLYMFKEKLRYSDILAIAILCSIFSYSAAGFFNDSNVCVAPLFWTMLGLGITINRLNNEMELSEV